MRNKKQYLYAVVSLLLFCAACHKAFAPVKKESKHYAVSQYAADSSIERMIAPYRQKMDIEMKEVIGSADTTLYKAQPESTLGNFIADAMLDKAREIDPAVDAAVMNYGGIRVPYIAPGKITMGKMYEVMPFDNMLCIVEMNGKVLQQFCNHMAGLKGWPVSRLRYTISGNTATAVFVNNAPLDTNKMYHIVTNDYVANGGDNCSFLIPLKKQQTNIFIRNVLIQHVKALGNNPLHSQIEKRVSYAE